MQDIAIQRGFKASFSIFFQTRKSIKLVIVGWIWRVKQTSVCSYASREKAQMNSTLSQSLLQF